MSNLLKDLAQSLDKKGIPYMIIGGQAVLVYGEPRLTRDVDLTLGVTPEELSQILEAIQKLNLQILVEDVEDFVRRTWVLPTLHPTSGLRVDFIFSWTPYEQQALKRAKTIEIDGYPVNFASPEDVIIHKILAGRPRDLEDVRTILRKQQIDVDYVREWLSQFEKALDSPLVTTFEKILEEEKTCLITPKRIDFS